VLTLSLALRTYRLGVSELRSIVFEELQILVKIAKSSDLFRGGRSGSVQIVAIVVLNRTYETSVELMFLEVCYFGFLFFVVSLISIPLFG